MARQATVQDMLTGHDEREACVFKCQEFLNALNLYKTCMLMCQQCLFKIDHLYGSVDVFISEELQCGIISYLLTFYITIGRWSQPHFRHSWPKICYTIVAFFVHVSHPSVCVLTMPHSWVNLHKLRRQCGSHTQSTSSTSYALLVLESLVVLDMVSCQWLEPRLVCDVYKNNTNCAFLSLKKIT